MIHKSSRPVLVVGPRFEPKHWPNDAVLVACVDGSPYAEHAVPDAAEWSASFDLPMWLMQVAVPTGAGAATVRSRSDFYETGYLRRLAGNSPHVNFDVLHSHHPARELADLTHRWPVAIMVMATHGRSGWPRLTLGSVAMGVVHGATCPVLLVPPGSVGAGR
jgi:nucleotide-binding universal stress UspA family protein